MSGQIIALDHFAGTGWGVACHWLGIREYGVEKMPEAIRTRRAVGFRTIYRDVWSGLFHPWLVPWHRLYIASPPCQTFSVAGRGEGRKALDQVLTLIDRGVWKDPAALFASGGDLGDERTALVLTPLAHIWAHRPELIALEQVPTVLPVWEAIAHVLRGLGYSVWTGNMQAEQYGVPQTRKRAILIARADGIPARPPVPTHSRYYSRTPDKLDPGVRKWVSMAEALGWGMTARPYPTIATGTEAGGTDPAALGGSGARRTVYEERAAGRWADSGDADNDGGILRLTSDDAATIQTYPRVHTGQNSRVGGGEAALLQSFPRGWGFTDRPAMTVHGHGLLTRGPSGQKQAIAAGLEDGTFLPRPPFTIESARKPGEQRDDYLSLSDRYEPDAVNFTVEEAAVLQSYPSWAFDRPATTVAGDSRIWPPGHKINADDVRRMGDEAHEKYGDRKGTGAYRATPEEAAALQSYPRRWPEWTTEEVLELIPEGGDWRDLPDDVARVVMGGAYESGGGRTGYFRRLHRDRPAPTIVGSPSQKSTYLGHPVEPRPINEHEAATLQTYPMPFPFQGNRGKQFLQIGNAVPPLMAAAILRELIAPAALAQSALDESASEWDEVFGVVAA